VLAMQPRTEAKPTTRNPQAVLEAWEVRQLVRLPDRRGWKGKRAAALLAVLSYGLRIGEATRLRLADLREDRAGGMAVTVKTLKRKDHRRSVVLEAEDAALVRDWLGASGSRYWLFPGQRDNLSTDAAQAIVTRYLKALGRPDCSAHNLRHSFCTNVVRETGSIWIASELAGHSDIRLTARVYGHASLTDARTAASALAEAKRRRKPRAH
jgi:integrase/recombinase XerD